MNKGKTIPVKLVAVLSFIAILAGLYLYLTSVDGPKYASKSSLAVKELAAPKGGTFIEVIEKDKPDINKEFPLGIKEATIQDAIHAMSHQKVKAKDKWGFLPLTQDRVKRLLEVVKDGEDTYKHEDTYLTILESWNNQEFSSVDKHHNVIWNLQSGTIGRATGILSAAEEKAYIEKHYDIRK